MIGLATMAQELALAMADEFMTRSTGGKITQWYVGEDGRGTWRLQSRAHGRMFPDSPTGQYYKIIDRISRGEKP